MNVPLFKSLITNLIVLNEEMMQIVLKACLGLSEGCDCEIFVDDDGSTVVEATRKGEVISTTKIEELYAGMTHQLTQYTGGKSVLTYQSLEIDDYLDQHVLVIAS